jgi:hypothetical protein
MKIAKDFQKPSLDHCVLIFTDTRQFVNAESRFVCMSEQSWGLGLPFFSSALVLA